MARKKTTFKRLPKISVHDRLDESSWGMSMSLYWLQGTPRFMPELNWFSWS